MINKGFDQVSFIMDYESGLLNEDEIIAGFQHLINSGVVWQLQGSYGRMAAALIEASVCSPAEDKDSLSFTESFSQWLDNNNDSLKPESFSEFLEQTNDSI